MKERKPVTIWEDLPYQSRVKADLETARLKMQELLNVWLSLDVGDISDLNELQLRPEHCYRVAIDKLVPATVSNNRFSVKREQYLQTLDLPDPSELYRVAKETLKVSYRSVPDLFETDGQTVSLNKEVSKFYYTMADVVVYEPYQIALAADLKSWLEMTNSLNARLNHKLYDSSSPISNRFFFGICSFENTDGRGSNGKLNYLPEFLREVLQ